MVDETLIEVGWELVIAPREPDQFRPDYIPGPGSIVRVMRLTAGSRWIGVAEVHADGSLGDVHTVHRYELDYPAVESKPKTESAPRALLPGRTN